MKNACFFALIFWFGSLIFTYGQSSLDNIPRELRSKIRWMERQGFPASSYRWTEPKVNLHLQEALKYRNRSTLYFASGSGLIFSGGLLTSIGFVGLIFTPVIAAVSLGTQEVDVSRYGAMTIVGGVSTAGGLTLLLTKGTSDRKKARMHIQKAQKLYPGR
ncbi:MAG: hypothetical protein AAGE93_10945 [Bacteroidota bacterium]